MFFMFTNVRANIAAMKAANEELEKRLDFWMKEAHALQARLDDALDKLETTEALVDIQESAKRKRSSLRPSKKRKTDTAPPDTTRTSY